MSIVVTLHTGTSRHSLQSQESDSRSVVGQLLDERDLADIGSVGPDRRGDRDHPLGLQDVEFTPNAAIVICTWAIR